MSKLDVWYFSDMTVSELRCAGLSETAIGYMYWNEDARIFQEGNEYCLYIGKELQIATEDIDELSGWLEDAWMEEVPEEE